MDYIRKKRNVTYTSDSCKMYLRHDFKHTCAYCGTIEEVHYISPLKADEGFQKDHFIPQNGTATPLLAPAQLHSYSNMYYACSTCNRLKKNVLLPLDPCKDDILSGDKPHVQGGTEETNYIVTSDSPQGKEFIRQLDLNSRYHIELRKEKKIKLEKISESKSILQILRDSGKVEEEYIAVLENKIDYGDSDALLNACGGSRYGLRIRDVCRYLKGKGYGIDTVFEENELDVRLTLDGTTYLAKISPLNSVSQCRVKTSVLLEWHKFKKPCGILRFQEEPMNVRFYIVDFNAVPWDAAEYRIDQYIDL